MIRENIKLGDASLSKRTIDFNGYMRVADCPISSHGIFQYGECQVDENKPDSQRIVNVWRPVETLADPEMAATLEGVPLIDGHTHLEGHQADVADPQGVAPEHKGVAGVLNNVRWDPNYEHSGRTGWMLGDVTIYSRSMQNEINAGKDNLSIGFSSKITSQSGQTDEGPYEFIQTHMRGNHIALVDDARVKGARLHDDSSTSINPDEDTVMKQGDASSVEKLKALLPALQQFLSEEATEPAHQEAVAEGDNTGGEATGEVTPAVTTESAATPVETQDQGGGELQEVIAALKAVAAKLEAECAGGAVEAAVPAGDAEATVTPTVEGEKAGPTETKGGDAAALKRFYDDASMKKNLHDRASKLIGTFDVERKTAQETATYIAGKLGIKCADSSAITAVENFLAGAESVAKAQASKVTKGGDSAVAVKHGGVDAYLNEK